MWMENKLTSFFSRKKIVGHASSSWALWKKILWTPASQIFILTRDRTQPSFCGRQRVCKMLVSKKNYRLTFKKTLFLPMPRAMFCNSCCSLCMNFVCVYIYMCVCCACANVCVCGEIYFKQVMRKLNTHSINLALHNAFDQCVLDHFTQHPAIASSDDQHLKVGE